MRSREEVIAAVTDAVIEGQALRSETNAALSAAKTFPRPAIATMLLGARTLRGLRAMRYLADHSLDDQVAIIGRSLAEASIDVEYVNVTTTRTLKKGSIELDPDTKVRLFGTHKAISAYRTFEGCHERERLAI
jgi:hypothetical protein